MKTMRKIEIVDYEPSWPAQYEAECALIRRALGDVLVEIHHIGSTAVPGLAAKPIIDILLEVEDLAALDALNSEMEAIGYNPKGEFGIPHRRYFPKGGDNRSHHVHAFVCGDSNVARHLAFRDYLRRHPDVVQEYAEVKRRVAQTCGNDSERYCSGKDAYVKRVEAMAIKEQVSIQALENQTPKPADPPAGPPALK
jgi:GrpB-like predicted nucleotidyltransferase (UPF0157 family)